LKDWKIMRQKPVAVLGAGISGEGICALLKHLNWEYRAYDEQKHAFSINEACSCSIAVISPGFKEDHPWRKILKKCGVCVISEIDFASNFTKSKLVGITGTNGKTTVTSLLAHLWNSFGFKACCAGNIGIPLSKQIALGHEPETIFLEISSFQAKDMYSTKLDSLIWTNFEEDHIDHHGTLKDYFYAKCKLLNLVKGENLFVGKSVMEFANRIDFKLPEKTKIIEISKNENELSGSNRFLSSYPQRENLSIVENFIKSKNIKRKNFLDSVKSYKPKPHRLGQVCRVKNACFWNDSKSTNFASAIAACKNFSGNVFWIGGGKEKGGIVEDFAKRIIPLIWKAFLIGESAKVLSKIFKKEGLPFVVCESLEEAVNKAFRETKEYTNILLSPGYASFDSFKNYEHRGKSFENYVLNLKNSFRLSTDNIQEKSFAH
jgi:UDP-N-acetylmuramoylalanine--D-glutamate ligase